MELTNEELIEIMHKKLLLEKDDSTWIDIYYQIAPQYLYQYRGGGSVDNHIYDVENLYQNKVWASSASRFNDPFDCQLLLRLDQKVSKRKEKEFNNGIREVGNHSPKYTYVSCFSKSNSSLCMWSYYANNHEGFCVEYETELIKEVVLPVNYSDKIYNTSEIEKWDTSKLLVKATLTKSLDWKHEEEWRMVSCESPDMELKPGKLLDSCKPSKIYMGCRSRNYLRESITEYCKSEEVDLDLMEMGTGKYGLMPKEILRF